MEIDDDLKEKFKDGAVGSIYGAIFGRPWITIPLVGLALMILLGWHSSDYKFMLIAGGVFAAMLTAGIFFELYRLKERRRNKEQRAAMAAELRQHYLAHWTIMPEEWKKFGIALLRRYWLLTVFLVMQVAVQSGYAWFGDEKMLGRNADIYTNLLIISFALTTLVAQGLLTDIGKAFSRMKPTEVFIGESAVLLGGQLYSWAAAPYEFHAAMIQGNPSLLTLRLTGSSVKGIFYQLIKSFTIFGGAFTSREWTLRLPVPSANEHEITIALRQILRPVVIASALRERAKAMSSSSTLSGAGYSRAFVDFEGEIANARNGTVSGTITNKHNFTVNNSAVTFNGSIKVVNLTQDIEIEGECLLGNFKVLHVPMANRDKIEVRFVNNDGTAAKTTAILAHVNEEYQPVAAVAEESQKDIAEAVEARLNSPRAELRRPRLPILLLLLCYGFGAYTVAADYLWYRGTTSMRLVAPLRNEVLRPETWVLTSMGHGTGTPFDAMVAAVGLAFIGFILGGMVIAGIERLLKLKSSKLSGIWFMLMIAFAAMGVVRGLFFPELTTILNTETRNVEITEWDGVLPEIAALPSTTKFPFDSIAGFLPEVHVPAIGRVRRASVSILTMSMITKGGRRFFLGSTEISPPQTNDDSLSLVRRARYIGETLDSVVGARGVPANATKRLSITTQSSPSDSVNIPSDNTLSTLLSTKPEDSIAVTYIVRCDTALEISYTAPFAGGFLSTKKTKTKGSWKFGFKTTAGSYLSVIATTVGYASVPATIEIQLDGKRFKQQTSSMGLVSADGQIPLKKEGK